MRFGSSMLIFCRMIRGLAPSHGAPGRSERRVDYREVLSAEQFEVFSKLREVRKEVAEREAVAVYAIFTK